MHNTIRENRSLVVFVLNKLAQPRSPPISLGQASNAHQRGPAAGGWSRTALLQPLKACNGPVLRLGVKGLHWVIPCCAPSFPAKAPMDFPIMDHHGSSWIIHGIGSAIRSVSRRLRLVVPFFDRPSRQACCIVLWPSSLVVVVVVTIVSSTSFFSFSFQV